MNGLMSGTVEIMTQADVGASGQGRSLSQHVDTCAVLDSTVNSNSNCDDIYTAITVNLTANHFSFQLGLLSAKENSLPEDKDSLSPILPAVRMPAVFGSACDFDCRPKDCYQPQLHLYNTHCTHRCVDLLRSPNAISCDPRFLNAS